MQSSKSVVLAPIGNCEKLRSFRANLEVRAKDGGGDEITNGHYWHPSDEKTLGLVNRLDRKFAN